MDAALLAYDLPGLPWEVPAKRPYILDPLAEIAVLLPKSYYFFKFQFWELAESKAGGPF